MPHRKPSQNFKIALLGGPEFATRMTCREAGCANERNGWTVVLDPEHNEQHAKMARDIDNSGRQFTRQLSEEALIYAANHREALGIRDLMALAAALEHVPAGMFVWLFPPGQQCFEVHQDREVVFSHDERIHTKPLDYNEDYNENAYRVNRAIERG